MLKRRDYKPGPARVGAVYASSHRWSEVWVSQWSFLTAWFGIDYGTRMGDARRLESAIDPVVVLWDVQRFETSERELIWPRP